MSLQRMPKGMVADSSANFGLFALLENTNLYCGHLENITTAGTNSLLTGVQCRRRVIRLTAGASGGFTITLPTTAQIFAALGNTIVTDGTFGFLTAFMNDNVGQTGTLTAGDASTTITGTATVATNTTRTFMCMVTAPTTLTYYNIGSQAL